MLLRNKITKKSRLCLKQEYFVIILIVFLLCSMKRNDFFTKTRTRLDEVGEPVSVDSEGHNVGQIGTIYLLHISRI